MSDGTFHSPRSRRLAASAPAQPTRSLSGAERSAQLAPRRHGLSLAIASALVLGLPAAHAQSFPASFELSSLDGSNGFRLDGVATSDYSGGSVSYAGDINGDGLDDLIIGADFADPNGNANAGSSYVVFGQSTSFAATLALSSLDGSNGFRLDGVAALDRSGFSVSAAGDINGDGLGDLIIGAFFADPNGIPDSGSSYVVFGRSAGFAATLELSSLDGSNGFRLDGAVTFDLAGHAVKAAGDIDGDGLDDLIIGAYRADPNGELSGSSYVIYGRSTGFASTLALSSLDGSTGFRLDGVAVGDAAGFSVSAAGDINGDGLDDLIIGAPNADPDGNTRSGSSYVVFGQSTAFAATFALSSLGGSNGFRIDGTSAEDLSGISVSAAGDINGDGRDDLIIGASRADPNGNDDAGSSYVVYGQSTGFAATLALTSLNGSNGFRIDGEAEGDYSGGSVSAAGDINGDGVDDLFIGAFFADPNGINLSGSSYVIFGQSTGFAATLALASLVGSNGFRLDGAADGDFSGWSVSGIGDFNGDGVDDLIIGAVTADPHGNANAGSSYVVFGRALPRIQLSATSLAFGDISVGQTSPAQPITLSNSGLADLTIGNLALSGTHAGDFALSADGCSGQTLAPTTQCTVTVALTPSATGARTAQIDIPSSAASSPDVVALSGNGVQESTITSITSDMDDPSVVGQSYTVAVDVVGDSNSPAGSVTISNGTNSCDSVMLTAGTSASSSASCILTSSTAGPKTLTAVYEPASGAFAESSDTEPHQVNPAGTAISVIDPPSARINTATAFSFALTVAAPGGGTPTGTVMLSSGSSSCQVAVPAAMSSCELSFNQLGSRPVSAIFTSTDGNHLDANSATAGDLQTLVFALSDLAVTKTDTVDSYAEGDLLVYTITLRNLGADRAENLRLLDTVPAGLVDVLWTCDSSGGAVCPASSGSGDLDAQIASYPVGALLNYSYYGNVSGNPDQILNTVTLELPDDDTIEDGNPDNNSASDLNLRNLLFADGFEAATVTAASGSYRLPSAALLPVLDDTARVVFVLDDANGQAARVYARVFDGQLQYALAQRASSGLLRLGPWTSYDAEPLLSWSAREAARGWVVETLGLQ